MPNLEILRIKVRQIAHPQSAHLCCGGRSVAMDTIDTRSAQRIIRRGVAGVQGREQLGRAAFWLLRQAAANARAASSSRRIRRTCCSRAPVLPPSLPCAIFNYVPLCTAP